MDGYAVRTADVAGATEEFPAVLTVIGDVAAGSGELPEVGPGQAARIMTGAPLPPGAEAVVPVEWTDGGAGGGPATDDAPRSEGDAGAQRRGPRPPPGRRPAPTSARAAATSRRETSPWRPARSSGRRRSACSPPSAAARSGCAPARAWWSCPPAANSSSPARSWAQGQIHDSNSFPLTAAARDAGAIAYRVGAVADDAETLRATIEDQLIRADLLVTTGGVSVGAYDVVKEALSSVGDAEEPGSGVDFRKLAMQPGKPQGFGSIGPDHIPLLALPGNPVSSYVSFELFVRPAIRALMGLPKIHRPRSARASCATNRCRPRRAGASSCAVCTTRRRAPSPPSAAPARTWSRPSHTPTR